MREVPYLLTVLQPEALVCPSQQNGQRRGLTQNMQSNPWPTFARRPGTFTHIHRASTVATSLTEIENLPDFRLSRIASGKRIHFKCTATPRCDNPPSRLSRGLRAV